MTSAFVFLADVLLTTLVCGGIAFYLKKPLKLLLVELCGTAERANFWLAFCNVTLVLVPLIFVLGFQPEIAANKSAVFEMAVQIKSALIGFVITLGVFGLALLRYIPKSNAKPPTVPMH